MSILIWGFVAIGAYFLTLELLKYRKRERETQRLRKQIEDQLLELLQRKVNHDVIKVLDAVDTDELDQ